MSPESILSVRSILEGCIERERLSVLLYDRAGKTVKDEKGRELVSRIRNEELLHVKKLKAVLETGNPEILGSKPLPEQAGPAPKTPPSLEPDASPKQIIAFAIRHEEVAIEYYSRYVDAFRTTELGDLFERLRKEEQSHREKLVRMSEKMF